MQPWIHLATAKTPQGGDLRLLRRGTEYSIRLEGGNELMNSRLSGSEEALATLSFEHLTDRAAPRVLIGGLGMGFTLRAAQEVAPPTAQITVAEIVPELVSWAQGPMAPVFGECLADPRVSVETQDVAVLIRAARGAYDAILLDVDNGPDGLTRAGNDGLYAVEGLNAARRALANGGILAIWSAHPDTAFTKRLSQCGFDAQVHAVRASRAKRGSRHTIWIARAV
ncbi:spermidine synthase [Rhodobacteraceae bacterium N5(2021)]|uniref:Spermidine synthase n=1 Tax=Gymnodinialimonas phycosphaerae TaxID=2841589 RepID=A0A975TWI2_9RHOB|nr:spermidine synthase [Gymnodinialimonas phycosphaerae]MBY4891251.1 spermidine synthase [Gymnodinialimonas phycosphaerae]